jgi:hypothetical protein
MVPRKQAGHMTCTRPQAKRQIPLAMRASSTHDPKQTLRSPRPSRATLNFDRRRQGNFFAINRHEKRKHRSARGVGKRDRRDSRSTLAVNKLYQLVNDECLFTDYAFYQISNRYHSDQFALINNGKVANSLLSHNGHAFFHSLIKVSV